MKTPTIGILGDGQLSRMLALAARTAGRDVVVFGEGLSSPAGKAGVPFVSGRTDRMEDLQKFFLKAKLIIFENEFLDCKLLARASQATGVHFVPSLDNIFLFQNKLSQKSKLNELAIPASPYIVWDGREEPAAFAGRAFDKFGECVFKWSRLGYDGKGVLIARDKSLGLTEIIGFMEKARNSGSEIYAEKRISFRRELAIVACYSIKGEFAAYPLVISVQENGVCRSVTGPAVSFGVSKDLETQAMNHAKKLAESCRLHGCFALEFFETGEGELLVNEIAPRVHNTGHYTLDAAETSQFENHLRAVTGLPLGPTAVRPAFFMWNILGPPAAASRTDSAELRPNVPAPFYLHWYEKDEIRAGRKLGHINATAGSPGELGEAINAILKIDREWALSLRGV